jgi:acetyl/propionyl-CoA carboxylase alpha subunit
MVVEQEEALGGLVTKDGRRAKLGQLTSEGLSVLDAVMKMYMPLIAKEDGIVQLIKQPGATLEAGDILGNPERGYRGYHQPPEWHRAA